MEWAGMVVQPFDLYERVSYSGLQLSIDQLFFQPEIGSFAACLDLRGGGDWD